MEFDNLIGASVAGIGTPLVSVCIPTYNGQEYLRECLDSVLAQTFPDFEILVVDDHSRDDTLAILGEYAKRDRRIRVERNPVNFGIVGNWNRCVELAHGEWIKFVFQDDLISPTCLEKLVSACGTGFPMAVCRRNIIFDAETEDLQPIYRKYLDTYTVENVFPGATEISAEMFREDVLDYLDWNFIGEPNTVLLRKDIFHYYGRFHPRLIQLCDHEYWIRVAIHTGFIYVPETLATFRVHRNASSVINRTTRKARKDQIDKVLLWNEFTFNPVYTPLRIAASERRPPIDFMESLSHRMGEIRSIARGDAAGNQGGNKGFGSDWEKILEWYPSLRCVPKGFISRFLWKRRVGKRRSSRPSF
jgi:glycosyltransferase involved in cell wall biosynthesis